MAKFCQNCGTQLDDSQAFCTNCGAPQNGTPQPQQSTQQFQQSAQQFQQGAPINPQAKSKIAAGLLGIFLGAWGVHNFYLGNTGRGIAQIIVTIVTCGIGALWGFIEGIMILTGSINTDANGIPLQD
jgi:TM2 domain-containing membrane protein YozV